MPRLSKFSDRPENQTQLIPEDGMTQLIAKPDWCYEQSLNPTIKELISSKREISKAECQKESLDVQPIIRHKNQLRVIEGVLFKSSSQEGQGKQLVLPRKYQDFAFTSLHNDMGHQGHQGRERALSLLKSRFFWVGIAKDVADRIANYANCVRRKTSSTNRTANLVSIEISSPMELVCMNYLCLERSKGGYENILVITYHFTRHAQAIPTKNQTAHTTAMAFMFGLALLFVYTVCVTSVLLAF